MTEPRTSVIRAARARRGIGVRELARRAQVTPGAVSQWEASELRGTLRPRTLDRVLQVMGTSVEAETPKAVGGRFERREDRVALELHRAVAKKLIDDLETVVDVVPPNIAKLRSRVRGVAAEGWLDEWEQLAAERDIGGLIGRMMSTDPRSVSMRQVSPFAGVLTDPERLEAIERAGA